MLSCKEVTEIATDFLEENLPWRGRFGVQVHLWMCRYCRRYLDQMRKVVRLLKRLPREPVPSSLLEAILPQFQEKRDKHA